MFVKIASSDDERRAANELVIQKYSERGYDDSGIPSHCISLIMTDIVGTLSLTIDSPKHPMLADHNYKVELDKLRASGSKLCELARFAFNKIATRDELDSIWKFLHEYDHDRTDLVIEVHPHHKRYYERVFGFEVIASNYNEGMERNSYLMRMKLDNGSTDI